jgi:fused signal recognition particle receptor
VLGGAHFQDEGRILIDGKEVSIHNPIDSQRHGVAIIYQEFNLIPALSAYENIFLGREQHNKGFVRKADEFRQAEQLFERIGVPIVKGEPNSDPASVAHRAVAESLETGSDVCIIDTAGRLQTQANLMDQLAKIRRVVGKQIPDAPHEALLVLDATAGQNGLSQAKGFSEAAGCTGIVLAKLDGTAKGGVVIPIRQQFDLPVKYVGTGEKTEDLALFNVDRFVDALFAD